jgi:deoxyribodipyrimidine photo-lyase
MSERPVGRFQRGLYWFTHDLRLHDLAPLLEACERCQQLLFVYCHDSRQLQPGRYGERPLGTHRERFLAQSLDDLASLLEARGQYLVVESGLPVECLGRLIEQEHIEAIFRSAPVGFDERRDLGLLEKRFPARHWHVSLTHTLFQQHDLPFSLPDLPATFTPFRKRVEGLAIPAPTAGPASLPRPPLTSVERIHRVQSWPTTQRLMGGCTAGAAHLDEYFSSQAPARYKQTRNALSGWDASGKFSAWLAAGCISAREVVARIAHYETTQARNESTQWLVFELLWREYFQWYALRHGAKLFDFSGVKSQKPLTSFYPERYRRWCMGTTPFPLVNACMNELRDTGWLSNRGRQIVASALVHELGLDWRFGASWFEYQLMDYDVAVNWGNWQYLAGVGADPRGHRHFDLEKQAAEHDPDGSYRQQWAPGDAPDMLDSVDAADWPL